MQVRKSKRTWDVEGVLASIPQSPLMSILWPCTISTAIKHLLSNYGYLATDTNTNTSAFFLFSICRVWMRGWHRYIIWWWCLLDHKYKRQKWYDPALRIWHCHMHTTWLKEESLNHVMIDCIWKHASYANPTIFFLTIFTTYNYYKVHQWIR